MSLSLPAVRSKILRYRPNYIGDGLVLYLDAGDKRSYGGSGTPWNDLSGLNNHGTLVNGPTYTADNGGAIVFNGTNNYVSVPDSTSLRMTTFTIALWVKTSTTNGIMLEKYGSSDANYQLYQNGWWRLYSQSKGNQSSNTISDGNWHFVAGTYDGSTFRLFTDNNADNTTTGVTSLGAYNSNDVIIGGRSPSSFMFNGRISQAMIYNRALSAAEISQNFNAFRGRYGV